jgi:hypothetical protein
MNRTLTTLRPCNPNLSKVLRTLYHILQTRPFVFNALRTLSPNTPRGRGTPALNLRTNNEARIYKTRFSATIAAIIFSPRRAAVLGYLTSLLLRTLPAQYNDPCPQAGTPMSAAQLAERAKPKSLAPPVLEAVAPTSTNKPALTDKPVITDKSLPQLAPQPLPQSMAQPSPTTPSS